MSPISSPIIKPISPVQDHVLPEPLSGNTQFSDQKNVEVKPELPGHLESDHAPLAEKPEDDGIRIMCVILQLIGKVLAGH